MAEIEVSVWRGNAEGGFQTFHVPAHENQTVLDIVTAVQRLHAPDLAYRFACRVGVCGSCAMTVNGRPRWTCRTHVRKLSGEGPLTIEPLRNMPRIKDLACDMRPFFEKWQKAGGVFEGSCTRHDDMAGIDPSSRMRVEADAAIECINCAVCYAACDVVGWDEDYAGPAALNRLWSLANDARHSGRNGAAGKAFEAGGCASCHSHGNCTRHCPVGLSPSNAIAGLKRAAFFGVPGRRK